MLLLVVHLFPSSYRHLIILEKRDISSDFWAKRMERAALLLAPCNAGSPGVSMMDWEDGARCQGQVLHSPRDTKTWFSSIFQMRGDFSQKGETLMQPHKPTQGNGIDHQKWCSLPKIIRVLQERFLFWVKECPFQSKFKPTRQEVCGRRSFRCWCKMVYAQNHYNKVVDFLPGRGGFMVALRRHSYIYWFVPAF